MYKGYIVFILICFFGIAYGQTSDVEPLLYPNDCTLNNLSKVGGLVEGTSPRDTERISFDEPRAETGLTKQRKKLQASPVHTVVICNEKEREQDSKKQRRKKTAKEITFGLIGLAANVFVGTVIYHGFE